MSVIVCQRGARHRYAVPKLLNEVGLLTALYTDSCDQSPLGKIARWISPYIPKARRLVARATHPIPHSKIIAKDNAIWEKVVQGIPTIGELFVNQGMRGATIVYSMMGNEPEFIQFAKSQGATIIMDVILHPYAAEIVEIESKRYPWAPTPNVLWKSLEPRLVKILNMADIYLCPSATVAEGVATMCPDRKDRIRLCPYGSSFEPANTNANSSAQREENRILFAGADFLRKGLHYFAEAAQAFRASHPTARFLVAGLDSDQIPSFPGKSSLEFLGKVPLDRMRTEFERSTLFCLPSLAEGQAGVVLEAMALDCPVIATPEAGVDFRHGADGWLVPARDAAALVDAFTRLLPDPSLRKTIADNAKERFFSEFSMKAWGGRLVKIVEEARTMQPCTGFSGINTK